MKRNKNLRKALLAGIVSLGMVAPLALPLAAQAQSRGGHGGGGGARSGGGMRGGGSVRGSFSSHSGGSFRSSSSSRVSGSASFRGAPAIRGGSVGGRSFVAGNAFSNHGGGGNWHGRGVWNQGHFGYWDGGVFINLNAPFYGGPGYYGYPAYYGAPSGVYVHFHGTVQGVDVNDGFLGVAADNGLNYNVQTASAGSFGPGERIVVHGTDFGNTVQPTVLHEERPR